MKRKFGMITLIAMLICACIALTACIMIPGNTNNIEKQLDSPTDITIQNVSANSIFIFDVLYGEEGGGATEISIDGATWIDFDNSVGYEIGGLTPNTEYTVYARQKGYGDYKASEAFTKKVTTLRSVTTRVPENVTANIYHGTVTLKGITDEMEISYDDGKTYVADKTHTYTEKGDKTILVRYKTTADYLAGNDLKVKVSYNDFAGGSGTETDPYLIETYAELMAINNNKHSGVYKLMEDIRFPETPTTEIIVFSGTFLGNNKKFISPRFDFSGITDYNNYGGIFHTNGSDTRIFDLTVENAEITTHASHFVHGLLINSSKEISGCSVSGKLIVSCMDSRTYLIGGLCGEINDEDSVISDCYADVTVGTTGRDDLTGVSLGGLVGQISSNCTIERSSAKITALLGAIKLYNGYAGGLVGSVEKAEAVTISESQAESDLSITAINCFTGGIIALSPNTDITNCFAKGNITASGRNISRGSKCISGGIAAGAEDNSELTGSVTNCYSAVNFSLNQKQSNIIVSGIICNAIGNSDMKIENCLFAGKITVDEGFTTNTVTADAIVSNANGYTVNNNYITEDSAKNIETDNDVTVVGEEDYLTANWFKQTLKFDETVWNLTDGKLPELK